MGRIMTEQRAQVAATGGRDPVSQPHLVMGACFYSKISKFLIVQRYRKRIDNAQFEYENVLFW